MTDHVLVDIYKRAEAARQHYEDELAGLLKELAHLGHRPMEGSLLAMYLTLFTEKGSRLIVERAH